MCKEYKFGIIKRRSLSNRTQNIGICSCGQINLSHSNIFHFKNFECEKCGNTYFVDTKNQYYHRFTIPYLEILRKDNRGFRVRRTNISIIYDGNDSSIKVVKENLTRTMDFDIIDEKLQIFRGDELEYDYSSQRIMTNHISNAQRFFVKIETDDFLDFISNDTTRSLFKCVTQFSYQYGRKDKIIVGLTKLFKYKYLQTLANAGIPKVGRFITDGRGSTIDITKTKPHEILKLPKFMMKYIREDISISVHNLDKLQSLLIKVDNNKIKEILEIVKDESTISSLINTVELLLEIYIDYDYTNLKKLILYLFRDTRLTQGITTPLNASTLLRDYIRMSTRMGLEYEKYPKSLKKEHDIAQMNYKVNEDKYKQEAFKNVIAKKSYQNLTFKDKEYVIITPTTSDDIVKEGNQLSHCVASYVNDVTEEKCKILFLRKADEIDEPLATIEIRGLNIRQAKGRSNRNLRDEEKEFISKWAKKKELNEAYY